MDPFDTDLLRAELLASLGRAERARLLALGAWRLLPLSAIASLGSILSAPAFVLLCKACALHKLDSLHCCARALAWAAAAALLHMAWEAWEAARDPFGSERGSVGMFMPPPGRSKRARLLAAPACLLAALCALCARLALEGPSALPSSCEAQSALAIALAAACGALCAPASTCAGLAFDRRSPLGPNHAAMAILRRARGRAGPPVPISERLALALEQAALPSRESCLAAEAESIARSCCRARPSTRPSRRL